MINFIKKMKKARKMSELIKKDQKADSPQERMSRVYSEEELDKTPVTSSLDSNLHFLKLLAGTNVDLVTRKIELGRSGVRPAAILYFENLIDSALLDQHIVRPLVLEAYTSGLRTGEEIIEQLRAGNLITRAEIKEAENFKKLMDGLLIGEAVLFVDGLDNALVISIKGYESRSVSEPDAEPVVRGARDSFVETLSINLSLIRRRLQTPNLVIEVLKIGNISRTKVCFAYIRGTCSADLVSEVRKRLERIDIDGVLESGYIEEFIQDDPYSPFPQLGVTERPDRTAAALLEGRVAIFTDNTPMTLLAPGEFFSLMQAAEDYYNRYIFSTLVRLIRFIAFVMALILPAAYVAISTYHQEMIPTQLLVSIIAARSGVPLPAFLEALIMEFSFELLREAGVRLPRPVGQAVSIVGALVIGQAAVQASLVSPLMVIIVAVTGIANFTIPQYNISLAVRTLRFPLMIMAAVLGLFGVMISLLIILLHLFSLRSFGVPYMAPAAPIFTGDLKDTVVRAPWWSLTRRPSQIARSSRRMPQGQIPGPPKNKGGGRT